MQTSGACRSLAAWAHIEVPHTTCNLTHQEFVSHDKPSLVIMPLPAAAGHPYVGVDFARKLCGVSIIRSGEWLAALLGVRQECGDSS
jgi:hypothetical protein